MHVIILKAQVQPSVLVQGNKRSNPCWLWEAAALEVNLSLAASLRCLWLISFMQQHSNFCPFDPGAKDKTEVVTEMGED